jgi:hypothetical protein
MHNFIYAETFFTQVELLEFGTIIYQMLEHVQSIREKACVG